MEHDKRVLVYPCYINKNYTVAQGRKIPKEAGCDGPTTPEIFDCVVEGLKLPADIERKRHPRDWMYLGRVRVQLKNEDGTPVNPAVPDRRTLMIKIAELVPRHPNRTGKAPAIAGGGASGSGAGGKKSGKKKK